MPVQPFAFRELPTTDQAGSTRNFEQLMAGLNPVWIKPVFENEWVNFGGGYTEARYTKDLLGWTVIEGEIKAGKMAKAAFTLPAGFRPGAKLIFTANSNAKYGAFIVHPTGAVEPNTGENLDFSLIARFRAEN